MTKYILTTIRVEHFKIVDVKDIPGHDLPVDLPLYKRTVWTADITVVLSTKELRKAAKDPQPLKCIRDYIDSKIQECAYFIEKKVPFSNYDVAYPTELCF